MPVSFKVAPDFHGPTLPELQSVLVDLPDPVEVRWTGSRQDLVALERSASRILILVVPDAEAMERATWVLGVGLTMSPADYDATRASLVNRDQQTWRTRVDDLGHARGTMLLCKLVADALRAGRKQGPTITGIARECVLDRLDPVDADVLLRLRTSQ